MMALWTSFLDWLRRLLFRKEMELALVGLEGAGKTSLVNVVGLGTFSDDMIPTVGFNMRKVNKGAVTIKMWDLGGQAIVFVVDTADAQALEPSSKELHSLLERPHLAGIPLLVLGNKCDLPDAVGTMEVIQKLDLKTMTGREVCVYDISCKEQTNIGIMLEWLVRHAKS